MMVNTSHRIEKLFKDSFSMGSGGRGRMKENEKDMRMTESEHSVATVPSNGAKKLVGTL